MIRATCVATALLAAGCASLPPPRVMTETDLSVTYCGRRTSVPHPDALAKQHCAAHQMIAKGVVNDGLCQISPLFGGAQYSYECVKP